VIDEMGVQPAFDVLKEDSLPAVHVLGTHVNQPCQPEIGPVPDAANASPGQNLQDSTPLGP